MATTSTMNSLTGGTIPTGQENVAPSPSVTMNTNTNNASSMIEASNAKALEEKQRRTYEMGLRLLSALVNRNYPSALGLSMIGADNTVYLPDTLQTPIHLAVERGMKGVINELTAKKANLESRDIWDMTPLLQAVLNGDQLAAKILLEHGAAPNPQPPSRYQQTPLHLAVRRNRLPLVQILIDNKADLNAPSTINVADFAENGWQGQQEYSDTALHDAARKGNVEIVEKLIDSKADLSRVDSRNRTPLMLASRDGHTAVARLMIMKGSDIHATSADGRTSMHMAASRGQNRIVQMLMDSEKDEKKRKEMTFVKDCNGETPRDMAATRIAIKIMDGEARRGCADICEKAYLKRARSPVSPKSHPSFQNQSAQ